MLDLRKTVFITTGSAMKRRIKGIGFLSLLALCCFAGAQSSKADQADDSALIDSFIKSKGYGDIIAFSSANIKQFWIDHSVISQENKIKVLLGNDFKSVPLKIQLANVDITQDCKVEVFSDEPDFNFSVLSNDLKTIGESKQEDSFIRTFISSASFHLDDTKNHSFFLQFASTKTPELNIKKIVLSFSSNSSFLVSPGKLIVSSSNCTSPNSTIEKNDKDNNLSILLGKQSNVYASNRILVSDNTLSNSVTIKNTGEKPTEVFFGYAPYTKEGVRIDNRFNSYYTRRIQKVISAEKGSNKIVVDSKPVWAKGCYLVLNAKENFSDFPNTSFVDATIEDVKETEEGFFEIIFNKTIDIDIKKGTFVRVHSSAGAAFLYTNHKILQPGEETTLSSTIKKNDNYLQFGPNKYIQEGELSFCRGTYYAFPVLIFISTDSKNNTTVQVKDFTVSY